MSKIQDLSNTYERLVGKRMFKTFVDGDVTPTKKYLLYMLKMWYSRKEGHQRIHFISSTLIDTVLSFESLLPYIDNKDIYHSAYNDYRTLHSVVQQAIIVREDKNFVREEHAKILLENDEYVFLQPLTHKGSVKYGANTRWCTSSKLNPATFKNYTNRGFLAYLISKKTKGEGYEKVALYSESPNTLTGEILIYNQVDISVDERQVLEKGWKIEDWVKIVTTFRTYATNKKIVENMKKEVKSSLLSLKNIDLEKLSKQIKFLNESSDQLDPIYSEAEETINKFIKQIEKQIEYAK
jgi:hypothetical protein